MPLYKANCAFPVQLTI